MKIPPWVWAVCAISSPALGLGQTRPLSNPNPRDSAATQGVQIPGSSWPVRISADIAMLKGESLDQSLRWLGDVELYYHPGIIHGSSFKAGFPVDTFEDQFDIDRVVSNRRFLKVVGDLSRLPRGRAAKIVNRELAGAVKQYSRMYEQMLVDFKDETAPNTQPSVGIPNEIDDNPDGSPTFNGARLRLLALLLTAGVLQLDDCHIAIASVVKVAVEQNRMLQDKTEINDWEGSSIAIRQSLYNRQLLLTAVLRTSVQSPALAKLLAARKITWIDAILPRYDVRPGPNAMSGIQFDKTDPNQVLMPFRYVSPLDDETFDVVLNSLGYASPAQ